MFNCLLILFLSRDYIKIMASTYLSGYQIATSGSSDSNNLSDLELEDEETNDVALNTDQLDEDHERLNHYPLGVGDIHIEEEVEVDEMPVEIIDDTVRLDHSPPLPDLLPA